MRCRSPRRCERSVSGVERAGGPAWALIIRCSAAAILTAAVTVSCAPGGRIARLTGADDAAWGPSLQPSRRDYYPALAKETGLTGRVGIECSVDGRGDAHNIVILESGGLVLDDAARKVFSEGRFVIPPDWSATGGPQKRFRYGVIFQLRGKADVARFEDHRLSVVITGSAQN